MAARAASLFQKSLTKSFALAYSSAADLFTSRLRKSEDDEDGAAPAAPKSSRSARRRNPGAAAPGGANPSVQTQDNTMSVFSGARDMIHPEDNPLDLVTKPINFPDHHANTAYYKRSDLNRAKAHYGFYAAHFPATSEKQKAFSTEARREYRSKPLGTSVPGDQKYQSHPNSPDFLRESAASIQELIQLATAHHLRDEKGAVLNTAGQIHRMGFQADGSPNDPLPIGKTQDRTLSTKQALLAGKLGYKPNFAGEGKRGPGEATPGSMGELPKFGGGHGERDMTDPVRFAMRIANARFVGQGHNRMLDHWMEHGIPDGSPNHPGLPSKALKGRAPLDAYAADVVIPRANRADMATTLHHGRAWSPYAADRPKPDVTFTNDRVVSHGKNLNVGGVDVPSIKEGGMHVLQSFNEQIIAPKSDNASTMVNRWNDANSTEQQAKQRKVARGKANSFLTP